MANMAATVILVVLCMAVQPSMQQILKKPGEIFKLNQESRPYGIIATSSSSEKALNDSGIFKMESSVERNGRRFIMGKISGANVVYVRSANRPQIHVAVTAQIMATHFNILGIILFGSAGGVNNSLNLGDVVIPGSIAFTGIWTWKKQGASSNGQLVFREFNTPENGDNLLGSVSYGPSEVYQNDELVKNKFWISPDARSLEIAKKIELPETKDNCLNPRKLRCLDSKNKVVVGTKTSSSDVYVRNNAYREFLWSTFKVSTVDTTSSAVALASMSNKLRFVVIRGVSNTAGASDESNSESANANVVKVMERFIKLDSAPPPPDFEE